MYKLTKKTFFKPISIPIKFRSKNTLYVILICCLGLQSCTTKKEILYFQDSSSYNAEDIDYKNIKIQPNDILSIIVTTPIPEAAIPYNIQTLGGPGAFDLEALKLQGYLVSIEGIIKFPVLGSLKVMNKTIPEVERFVKTRLEGEGHLKNATVNVRLLNAKVTVLGDVIRPGTFTFTEQSITLPQALGYAGDLIITGKRKNVLVIREENGFRTMNEIDLTTTNWIKGPYYYVKPNDVIIVDPNSTKIKSAGFIGNAGIVLTIASLILSSIVLISR